MKCDTESPDKSPRLTAHEITGSEPNDARSLILPDRRRFLAGSLMGAAGFTLASPLQRALALPGDPLLWTPEALLGGTALKFRWRTFFTVVELAASLLGFRPLVMTIKELIDAFLPTLEESARASQAQAQTQQALAQADYPHLPGSSPEGAPKPVGLFSTLAPDTGGLGLNSSLFRRVAYRGRAAARRPRQFFYPALKRDGINGITSHFDYDAGTHQAVGYLGGPTNELLRQAENSLRQWGYTTREAITQAVYPYRQQRISYGLFNQTYGDPDLYKTRQATATERAQIEVHYNFSRSGQGEGEIAFFRLEDMNSRKLMQTKRLRFGVTYQRDESS